MSSSPDRTDAAKTNTRRGPIARMGRPRPSFSNGSRLARLKQHTVGSSWPMPLLAVSAAHRLREAGQLGYLDFLDQILAEEISAKDSRRFRYPLLRIGQEPPGGVVGEIRPSRRGNREPCRARTLNFPARPMEPLYVTPGKRGSRKAPTGPCWPHDSPISPILRFAT